ncbi:T9SS type A sorting domain-containing protein [Psychroserpens sp. Hel_I_66]|uniref:T9SS type A sorting domain-containing protein n=1 Tax=Psychroserpens sp. Hel_I_66 TaxID=1250004 RepID=UPI0012E02863|nr:T9SS type A sorting domain-containing protein [Psychroserpens sp. Hel_I_66]
MSNFTRSGGRAKIWQSITNLSCCSIDLMTKQSRSMKTLVLIMLFAFSTSSVFAQDSARSTFFNRCLEDAPPGPSEEDVANLYTNQCGDLTAQVTKTSFIEGDDCAWNIDYTYFIKCGDFEEEIKISYVGGDISAPMLNEGAEVPSGGQNLNLCFDDIPAGPSISDIGALYSDNCSDVIVNKFGTPSGNDCEWIVTYKFTIQDACGNMATELDIIYSGGDTEAPSLNKNAELPSGQTGLNLCFSEKAQGPTEEDIAALFEDNCGNVNVVKTGYSKGSDCKWMAQYTYTIQDDCGNFADSITVYYSGGDSEAPQLNDVPEDITVSCVDLVPTPDTKNVNAVDNCADDLEIIVSDSPSTVDSCLGGVITRTYSVTDNCGYTDSDVQIITVLPTPESTINTPELPSSISCADAAGYIVPEATYDNGVSQGLCSVSGSIEAEVNIEYTACGGTITVNYNGVDSCDRPLSAGPFFITVDPADAPIFDEMENMTISCEEAGSFEAGTLGYSNGAENEACLIEGSVQGEATPEYNACGGEFEVSYTYTDLCGNTITAKKLVTVLPADAPVFDEVEDMTISCEEAGSFTAGSLGYSNGAESEACLIEGSVQGEATPEYNACGGEFEVSYTYTDLCGNTITATKLVTVLPADAPVFDEVENMTISCEEAGSFTAGSLGYLNGAESEACLIEGSVQGEATPEYNACGGEFEVSYTYTDLCGNTITAKKLVTVLPADAPVFDEVEDMTISCEEAGSFEAGTLGYSNGAENEACLISGSVQGEATPEYNACGGEFEVSYTYTDLCGNTITATKLVTVLPADAPVFDEVENMTISCEEAGSFTAGSLGYSNGAESEACLIEGSVQGEATPEYNACGGEFEVSYTYTDLCGNTITAKKLVTVLPADAPVFDEVEDMTISCEEAGSFTAGSLGYSNGAENEACLISGSVQGEATPEYNACGGEFEVSYTYTDLCGNTITATKLVTVLPADAPVFDEVENMTISCEEAGSFIAGSLGYSNGAESEACLIEGSVQGEATPEYNACGGEFEVSYTYTDLCGNTITAKKLVTVLPADAPVFDEVEDMTISCEEAGSFTAGSLGYSNGAESEACLISGSVQGEATPEYNACGGEFEVSYTYTDLCGNTITATKLVTVLPADAPVFDEVENMTISCEEAGSFTAGSLGYSNGAESEACLIEGSVQGEATPEYNACGGEFEVSYTYTDLCGNTITAKKLVTVLPADAPVFDEVEDMTISCEEAGSFEAGTLGYSNGAENEACLISGSVQGEATPEYNACGGEFEVSYTYTDLCGNTITATKLVTVLPADAPVFDEIQDITITCELANQYEVSPLGYSNNAENEACLIEGSVQGELTSDYDACGGSLFVDYSYTDACGNTIEARKTLTVLPADAPVFDEVEDLTISCEEAGSFEAGSLSYSNNAENEACLIEGSVQGEATPEYNACGGEFEVSYTYTDLCGNTITATKLVTVLPADAPVFDEVEDMTISCEEAGSFEAGSLSYSNNAENEACLIEGSVQGEATPEYNACGGEFEVSYTYTDLCGNTITAKKLVTVLPADAPVFDEVEDMTISCEEAGSFTAGSLGYSNGAENEACLIEGSVQGEATPEYNACGGEFEVSYTYTDLCGNTITATKLVTVLPADAPVFDEVENISVSCEEAGSIVVGSLAYSNNSQSEDCLIAGEVQGELSGEYGVCGGLLFIDWTYTDECGNTISERQQIKVNPAETPVFDEVENMTISCEEAGSFEAGSLGYSNNAENASCLIEGSVQGEATPVYNVCGGEFEVSYTYTDACGNTITAKKLVTVLPADAPVFDEVEDMTISCEEAGSFTAGTLSYSNNAENEVCLIAGEVQGEATPDYSECGGTITVDYTYTDACGNTIEAQQSVTVLPADAAVFGEVEDMTISCEEAGSFTAGTLAYTNNAENEACLIAGEVQGEATPDYSECGGTIIVSYTYTDACQRTIEASQTITVEPAPMAQFDGVEDMTISCEEANSFVASSLFYTNGALNEACLISGSVPGELSGSYTECGGELTVNWTYTDACDRTITASKAIKVEPADAPVFEEVENMTISCEEAASFTAGSLSYTNGASTEACLIEGSVEGEATPDYTECGGIIAVTWTYTDDCDRTISAKKEVTVLPADAPVFDDVEDMTISCEEAGSFEAGTLSYSNNAENEACLIAGEVQGEATPEYNACGGEFEVSYTYTDACGNTITAKKLVTVLPADAPEFNDVQDITITCELANQYEVTPLGYTNNAENPACLIEGSVLGELSGDYDACGGTLFVDYTYTDDCGNTIEARKTITVSPADAPVFDEVEDTTISCEEAGSFTAGTLSYSNDAENPSCLISGEVQGELSGSYTECGGKLIVDFTYTDVCGNTIEAQQSVTVEPAIAPVFDEVEDMTISCEDANSFAAGTLAYTNNAENETCLIAGEVQGEATPDYTECGGTIIVSYTYTDACQRTIEASQTITVEPAPMAQFDTVEDMTVSCDEAAAIVGSFATVGFVGDFAPANWTIDTGATDGSVSITETLMTVTGSDNGSSDDVIATATCPESGAYSFDWSFNATDAFGAGYDAGFYVNGVLAIELADDNDSGTISVNCVAGDVIGFGVSTTDGILGAGTLSVTNFTVGGGMLLNYSNEGTGACEISGSVPGELSGSYTECGGELTVNWTYTDACDRTITASKTITVEPADAPVFEGVENMTISCEEAASFTADSLSYTNGASTEACLIEGSVEGQLGGTYDECGGTLFVDWTYTDDCDRTITAKKEITVLPADAAVFDGVDDMTISCEEANSFEAGTLSYSNNAENEACLIAGEIQGEATPDYTECGGTIIVNWTYTDNCDRTITATQTITVEEAPAATFDEIEDASIACEDLASYEAEFLSYTNGGTEACDISGSVQGEAEAFEGSCGTFNVNFTYTDDCGRTITATQTITVIDETAPMLVGELPQGESNLDLCFDNRPEGPTEAEIAALFADNCGNVNVTKTVSAPQEDDCHWAVMYRYEIQDDCGNFASPVKVFYNGGDQSAPMLTGTLPEGVTGLQCLSENPGAPALADIEAAYTDNCGTVTVTPLEPVIVGDDCGWTATYTYTIVDACDNFADNVVIVNSGADTMAPTLEGELPMGQNTLDLCIDSDLGEPTEEEIAALYVDNCGEVTVTKIEKTYGTDCEWIRVFEYSAKDACGNMADLVKVNYQGGDDSAPQPTGACDNEVMTITTEMGATCPAEASISLEVGDEISADDNSWSVAGVTIADMNGTLVPCFTDNCADVSELTYRVTEKGMTGDDCSTTLTVTFEVEDNCENVSEPFTCTFIIVDDTAPVIECPEDVDYGIVDATPTGFADKAPYTDNCQADGQTQDFSDELTSVINEGGGFVNRMLTSEADFSGTESFINFDDQSSDDTAYVNIDGTEYQSEGVTISSSDGNFILHPVNSGNTPASYFNSPTHGLANWNAVDFQFGSIDFTFDNLVNRAGFYVATNPQDVAEITISCLHNGTIVDSFSIAVGETSTFVGFESASGFDQININSTGPDNNYIILDDLRFEGGGNATEDFTLVRTFTANDGCDNTATCDVTYTWSIPVPCTDEAPVLECPEDVNFGVVLEAPTNFAESVSYTDDNGDGVTSTYTDVDSSEQFFGESTNISIGCITNGTIFAVLDFERTGFDDDGFAIYGIGYSTELPNNSYTLEYDSANLRWTTTEYLGVLDASGQGVEVFYSPSVDNAPDCDPSTWTIDNSICDSIFVDCGFVGLDFTEYTKTRTFTVTDSCDNESTCDVVYTWVIDNDIFFRSSNDGVNVVPNDNIKSIARMSTEANNVKEDIIVDFTAYPVPFDNEVNIAYTFEFDTDVTIELFDTKGLQVFSETNKNYVTGSNGTSTFDLSRYSSQMFYVKLTTSQGSVTKKIVSSGKK